MESGLVVLSLLPAAVMDGGTANGSAKGKTSHNKQTKRNESMKQKTKERKWNGGQQRQAAVGLMKSNQWSVSWAGMERSGREAKPASRMAHAE